MLEYYSQDNLAPFGFVAADDLNIRNRNQPNKRFRFYRRMMLSIFGKETFAQGYDINNSIYILINKEMMRRGLLSLDHIENEISKLYLGDYSVSLE